MRKKLLISICCMLAICFATLVGLNIYNEPAVTNAASTIEDYEAELKKIEADMKRLKEEMGLRDGEQENIVKKINALELELEALRRQQLSAEAHIAVVEYDLTVAADRIVQTEERLAERRAVFKDRLVSIYMEGEVTLFDVLFASNSFKEFLTNYDMLENVLVQDTALLESIKADIYELEIDKANLEQTKVAWQQINDDLILSIAEQDKRHESLVGERNKLATDIKAIAEMMDQLEKDSEKIGEEIAELQRQSQLQNEGIYSWPLPHKYNYITSPYDMRIHPISKIYKMHTGIDISVPKNVEIYAAASGEVILSRYYGSYGECIIVDHGDGVSTLYAHMNKRKLKVGDKVNRGDVLGYVGTSGASTGYHLHFEVRLDGKHTSPWDYVKKPQ